jgi:5-methylcytosine-specific restriction enzyme A
MVLQERDLLLPALLVIEELGTASTSQLQTHLRALLEPAGDDLLPLVNRPDDRFSQKVRNLKSHKSLVRRGWVEYEARGNNGYWWLTAKGRNVLEANREFLDALLLARHGYGEQQEALAAAAAAQDAEQAPARVLAFDEDETVLEGRVTAVAASRRTRSRRLREVALQHFAGADGRLPCAACEFDFEATYGERGAGYIEVHHRRPLFMFEGADLEQTLAEALRNLVPLCSNCHRMLHRTRADVWTLEQLRASLG